MKRFIFFATAITLVAGWVVLPPRAFSHDTLTTTVLFDREIVRILNGHCVMCHDESGPSFPLDTYEQTFLLRREIRADVIARHMSPWSAVPGYGDFANDNGLTLREIQFFVSWAEGWGPRNSGVVFTDVARAARPLKPVQAHPDFGRWELGEPTQKLQLAANIVEPLQKTEIKRTVIDVGLKSDRWLRAMEYEPSDRRVVHAAFFTIQETGQWIGSWTPWYGHANLPRGLAYRLPAGSHIVAEIYYRGAKEQVVDRGSLGLFYADGPPSVTVSNLILDAKNKISTGSQLEKFRATTSLAADTRVLALRPELHPGVKSLEVSARTPDGGTQVLLFAKDFAMDWPTPYILKSPVALPKGTELSVTAYYDGPDANAGGVRLTVSQYQGTEPQATQLKAQRPTVQRFKLSGVVQSVDTEHGTLVVQHGDIPGFMAAMTMSYKAANREDLNNLSTGDQIVADVTVSGTETHLENIRKRPTEK